LVKRIFPYHPYFSRKLMFTFKIITLYIVMYNLHNIMSTTSQYHYRCIYDTRTTSAMWNRSYWYLYIFNIILCTYTILWYTCQAYDHYKHVYRGALGGKKVGYSVDGWWATAICVVLLCVYWFTHKNQITM